MRLGSARKTYSEAEVRSMTCHFDPKNRIGAGGFGTVFRGRAQRRGLAGGAGKPWACVVKVLRGGGVDKGKWEESRDSVLRELRASQAVEHDCVAFVLGTARLGPALARPRPAPPACADACPLSTATSFPP